MTSRSESIEKLAEALAAAQGEIEGAEKDKQNPHFKNRYADLASIWEACRGPLSRHGLAVTQTTRVGDGDSLALVTTLLHASGQWLSGEMPIGCDPRNPQAMGSWLTYARRYSLAAIAGVCPEDDDGEAAHGRAQGQGNGATSTRGRDEDDRDFPAKDERKETWSQWVGKLLRETNSDWLREMTEEGVEPATRADHRELTNEPRLVNHLITRLIAIGKIDEAAVTKKGQKGEPVRDATKARAEVVRLFDAVPTKVQASVLKYLAAKRSEARAQLGMVDHEDDPGAPPPGKGEAYEEALSS